MARFDLYLMPSGGAGYVVDVQADLLDGLATRVVVPLLPLDEIAIPLQGLNPVFGISGVSHVLLPQAMGSISQKELGKPIGSLALHYDALTRALDFLFAGI